MRRATTEYEASTSGDAATYFKSKIRVRICTTCIEILRIYFWLNRDSSSSEPRSQSYPSNPSRAKLSLHFASGAFRAPRLTSPLPCNVKSEETRCALRAASSLRPTLPDFHRAKSSVAYHTSGRHADLACRESRLIVIVLLARGSAPCSSTRGAPPDGKGAARHVLHMDGRSPSPLDHRQSVDRVSPSVLFLVAVAVRSSPVSSFTSSSSFIKTNP